MKNWRTPAIFLLLAGLLTAGVLRLFNAEFAAGQLYPKYSSLRADPVGAKLFYSSLSRLPELRVARNFLPFASLTGGGAALLLLSADPAGLGFETLEKAAQRGNRVVVALPDDFKSDAAERRSYRHWGLRFPLEKEMHGQGFYFAEATGWTILNRRGGNAVLIERAFGKGTVVLSAESAPFSNEALADEDFADFSQLAAALGTATRVTFDESHLGVEETGSVMALAKRFRLFGFAAGLALLAALFIWRNAGSFPPPAAERAARPGAAPVPGLEALLRRHIAPRDLAAACWKEWSISRRRDLPEGRLRRAEAIAKTRGAQPLEAAREIQAVLQSKGEL